MAAKSTKAKAQTSADRQASRKRAARIWEEAAAGMEALVAALKSGRDPAEVGCRVTVRQVPTPIPPPPPFGSAEIRAAREAVGVSQQVFADLIGASASTVRAWERGAKMPSPMARRLLAVVAADPGRWRAMVGPEYAHSSP